MNDMQDLTLNYLAILNLYFKKEKCVHRILDILCSHEWNVKPCFNAGSI